MRAGAFLLSVAVALAVALPADGLVPGATEAPTPVQAPAQAPVPAPAPPPAQAPGAGATPAQATVTIDPALPGERVPREFVGLSFELADARQLAAYGSRGNLVALLRSLGPGLLRLGGASADTRVAWTDRLTPRPAWASSVLDMADLRGLHRLALRSGWRVLLTIGLAHYDPRAAAREAAAAKSALGPQLAGIEVGNEPDSYGRHGLRTLPWTASQYETEVSTYRRAIAASAPGIAVAGPGVSGSRAFRQWGMAEVRRQHPALLTGHHYPLRCDSVPAPTIEQLLSTTTREKEAESLTRFLTVAHASGTPFRMDESNTVSCGGRAGISDTFASTLWAVGYISQTIARGASGINLEGNPANCKGYSPLCAPSPARLAAGSLHAQPEWYALLLSRQLVGDRPLPTRVLAAQQPNLSVAALRTPTGALHFVVVEDEGGGAGVTLRLRVGRGFDSASMLALRAPAPAARSGVTLGGRAVAANGSWSRPAASHRVRVREGVVSIAVPAASAMLVTVLPARSGG